MKSRRWGATWWVKFIVRHTSTPAGGNLSRFARRLERERKKIEQKSDRLGRRLEELRIIFMNAACEHEQHNISTALISAVTASELSYVDMCMGCGATRQRIVMPDGSTRRDEWRPKPLVAPFPFPLNTNRKNK